MTPIEEASLAVFEEYFLSLTVQDQIKEMQRVISKRKKALNKEEKK